MSTGRLSMVPIKTNWNHSSKDKTLYFSILTKTTLKLLLRLALSATLNCSTKEHHKPSSLNARNTSRIEHHGE